MHVLWHLSELNQIAAIVAWGLLFVRAGHTWHARFITDPAYRRHYREVVAFLVGAIALLLVGGLYVEARMGPSAFSALFTVAIVAVGVLVFRWPSIAPRIAKVAAA